MDREVLIKEVINTEREIGILIAGFGSNNKGIARIDIDLALEKIRRLYDMVLQLESGDISMGGKKPDKTDIPQETVVENLTEKEEPAQTDNKTEEQEEITPVKEKEEDTAEKNVQEKVVPEEKTPHTPDLFETETKQKVHEKPKKEESAPAAVTMDLFGETIADKIAPEADKTVADSISEKVNEKSVADVIQKTKIDDLKQTIGINEKFFFINELFDGNMKDYNETIDTLNGFNTKNEAVDYFTGLKSKNQWKDDNEAVMQLMELIERRYFD
jgi:hypothetical protein